MQNHHYYNKGFCIGKRKTPFDLEVYSTFDTSLIIDFRRLVGFEALPGFPFLLINDFSKGSSH